MVMEQNRKIPVLLNLCDEISFDARPLEEASAMIQALREHAPFPSQVRGIRIGAETCGFLFADMKLSRFREIADKAGELTGESRPEIRLVIPVIEQSVWKEAADLIRETLKEPWLDSVAVNDFGALRFVREAVGEGGKRKIRIILGRFFDKRFRDPRTEAGTDESALLTGLWQKILERYGVEGLESECLDSGYVRLPGADMANYVHLPCSLQSSGQICEFSGIGMPEKDHFRIGRCRKQCLGLRAFAHHKELRRPLIKTGNALYIKNNLSRERIGELLSDGITVIYTDF